MDMEKIKGNFSERLREVMKNYNYTASDLAEKTGVNPSSVGRWLKGKHIPNPDVCERLAETLGVNPLWMMGFDVPKNSEYCIKNIGNRVQSSVRRVGLTPLGMSHLAGIDLGHIVRVIRGTQIPSIVFCQRVGEITGTNPGWILGGSGREIDRVVHYEDDTTHLATQEDKNKLSRFLRDELARKQISQKNFSDSVGASEGAVANWIHAKSYPSKKHLNSINEFFDSHFPTDNKSSEVPEKNI